MSLRHRCPDFARTQYALRDVTARLVDEIRAPTRQPPSWSGFEWSVARSAVSMLGIAGVLANRLRWQQPRHFVDFVHQQRGHIVNTQQTVRELLAQLDLALRQGGVPAVGLKGTAILALKLHAPGVRPMADVDLLAHPEHAEDVSRAVESCGYRRAHRAERHLTFLPTHEGLPHAYAEHPGNPLRIELHLRVYEPLPVAPVDITSTLWPRDAAPGINGYASRAELMRHLLLHAAGAMSTHTLRGIQPYEIGALAAILNADEWRELLGCASSTWWMYPPLLLAEGVSPGSVPAAVLMRASADCPALLERCARCYDLHNVSWCNLRISAFPAIAWSRTPLEALRYIRSRAAPGPTALGELRDSVQSAPSLNGLPWYQLGHGKRISRWVLGRPPRVQTMMSVMAACVETSCEGP